MKNLFYVLICMWFVCSLTTISIADPTNTNTTNVVNQNVQIVKFVKLPSGTIVDLYQITGIVDVGAFKGHYRVSFRSGERIYINTEDYYVLIDELTKINGEK